MSTSTPPTTSTQMLPEVSTKRSASAGKRAWLRLLRNRKALIGALCLLVIILSAVFAPLLATHDPNVQNVRNRLQRASKEHWLGTDHLGRDLYTRLLYGGRVSLRVGFISVGMALLLGGSMGMVAGFYGGRVESFMMRIVDVLLALPGFLLALAIVATLGASIRNVMIAVGIAYTPGFARVMRSAVIAIREQEYIAAARACGAGDLRVMFVHVLPNCTGPLIVQSTLALAGSILSAAGLSFLGLGAQPPTAEWGSMLNAARSYIRTAHHVVTYPGLAIMVTVLSLNMLGDGLRDALDPRMK